MFFFQFNCQIEFCNILCRRLWLYLKAGKIDILSTIFSLLQGPSSKYSIYRILNDGWRIFYVQFFFSRRIETVPYSIYFRMIIYTHDIRVRVVCLGADAGAGCIKGCELRKQSLCCRGPLLRRYCIGLEAVETLLRPGASRLRCLQCFWPADSSGCNHARGLRVVQNALS